MERFVTITIRLDAPEVETDQELIQRVNKSFNSLNSMIHFNRFNGGIQIKSYNIAADIVKTMSDASLELRQMHNHYAPGCKAGCPTLDVIERIAAIQER